MFQHRSDHAFGRDGGCLACDEDEAFGYFGEFDEDALDAAEAASYGPEIGGGSNHIGVVYVTGDGELTLSLANREVATLQVPGYWDMQALYAADEAALEAERAAEAAAPSPESEPLWRFVLDLLVDGTWVQAEVDQTAPDFEVASTRLAAAIEARGMSVRRLRMLGQVGKADSERELRYVRAGGKRAAYAPVAA